MQPAKRKKVSWSEQALLVFRKDLKVELSTGEVLLTSGLFAVLIVVIASIAFFSGWDTTVEVAPGVIWVAIAFAAVLAISRSWQRERENDAFSGLLVMPLARSAIFIGKAFGLWMFVMSIQALVVPLCAVLFDVPLERVGWGLTLMCLAASPGIAAAGTLFGAMTLRTGPRDLLLASVLFPLLAPSLIAAVAGTRELFAGAALAELTDYFQVMGFFAALFVVAGLGMFAQLVEP